MTPTLSALHDLLTAVAAHPDPALHQALSALRATLPAEALEHATTAAAIVPAAPGLVHVVRADGATWLATAAPDGFGDVLLRSVPAADVPGYPEIRAVVDEHHRALCAALVPSLRFQKYVPPAPPPPAPPPPVSVPAPIPEPAPLPPRETGRRCRMSGYRHLLGVLPDREVAARAGVDIRTVQRMRERARLPRP